MSANLNHELSSFLNVNLLRNVLQTFFAFAFAYYIFKKYLDRPHLAVINKLPALKLRFYHLLGHLHLFLHIKFRKSSLPSRVHDFAAILGYHSLFASHGLSLFWLSKIPLIQLFKADLVEKLLSHSTELKKSFGYHFLHPWLGTGLLLSHGEKWRNRRKMLTPAFHFSILKDFLPVFNKQSRILVSIFDNHSRDEFIDIVPLITSCSLDIISESILGKELHSQIQSQTHSQTQSSKAYVQAVNLLTYSIVERTQSPWLWSNTLFPFTLFGKRVMKSKAILHDFTNKIIVEKKEIKLRKKISDGNAGNLENEILYKRHKKALLDLLLDEHIDNNSITEEEIKEEVDTFTFEGHDTTAVGMCWALYLIGLHPWVQKKAHDELDLLFDGDDRDATDEDLKNMKYLECVIKESMRLYPSVPGIGREIEEDLNIDGHIIPKGAMCGIQILTLHRDPDVFPNPEKFDPERFTPENSMGRHPFSYVPFSAGPRNCIGQKFALMEEKVVLSTILRKFKLRSLDPRDRIHLLDEVILRPYNGLRIQIRLRNENFDFDSVYYRP